MVILQECAWHREPIITCGVHQYQLFSSSSIFYQFFLCFKTPSARQRDALEKKTWISTYFCVSLSSCHNFLLYLIFKTTVSTPLSVHSVINISATNSVLQLMILWKLMQFTIWKYKRKLHYSEVDHQSGSYLCKQSVTSIVHVKTVIETQIHLSHAF